jgi:outer membrane protein OmpA-like peptidoglycan-associated protein
MMKKIVTISFLLLGTVSMQAQSTRENLGSKVNSTYSEVRPFISADGKIMYFIVEGNPQNKSTGTFGQDVWYSEAASDGSWGQAIQAASPINDNNKYNAVFWVSPDGNRVLLRGAYEGGKFNKKGFSFSHKVDGGWSAPEKLNIKGYNQLSQDIYSGASLSNDGKKLLLYFSEEKNSNLNDIYVSLLDEDSNEWSKPTKLGDNVNTDDYDEISPFLASDGVTLYFSSDRPGGKGDHDIWMSRRTDETWKHWTEPVNMGDNVNTAKWEAYFSLDAKAEFGYFATNDKTLGGTDIVRSTLNPSQKPQSVVLLFGKVINAETKKPMDAKLFYDVLPGEKSEGNAISNTDGSYKVTLPYGKKYSVRASADNFFSVIDTLDFETPDAYKEMHRDLYLVPVIKIEKEEGDSNKNVVRTDLDTMNADDIDASTLVVGQILASHNILFDFAKSIVRADSYKELNKIARLLKKNPSIVIELSAHTDAIGSYSANLKLSEDRANSARQYLLSNGIDTSRVIAKGYGETTPVGDNKTEEGRQSNRRIEFRILKK